MTSQPPLWLAAVAFVCALGPLVFFHELGHYLVARMFRIPAETFSIGFGREVVGWTDKQGTRWKVAWLPLGGYVRFVGDMTSASTPVAAEDVAPELRERAFQLRPAWQRFLVVLAGPAANFLLAILIFAAFFSLVGTPQTNFVGRVQPGSAAASAGLQAGDRITAVAGRSTPSFGDIFNVVALRPNQDVTIVFERDGAERRADVKLGSAELKDGKRVFQRGLLGVLPSSQAHDPVPVARAFPMGVEYTARATRTITDGIAQIIRGKVSAQQLGGPIKIAQVAGEGAAQGPMAFITLLALLSINLGFINLLPVPMLDGGHLVFYAVEMVRRRPLSARALDWAFRGGLAALLALIVFTTANDLGSIGLWDRLQRLIG